MSEENLNGEVTEEQSVQPQQTYEQPVQPQQTYEQPVQPQQNYSQPQYQQPQQNPNQSQYQQSQYQQPQQNYNQPQYQQPQQNYSQPQYQQPQQPQQGKGMAIASMVLGIVALVIFCIWYISVPCAIVGLVLGILHNNKGQKSGMATAGIACSIISLALLVTIVIYAVIVGTATTSFMYNML